MQIEIKLKGIEEFKAFVKDLPRGSRIVVMREIAKYILGNDARGLRHEPAYRVLSRKAAWFQRFQSEKQRKWFFAALESGEINPWRNNRTHAIQEGWEAKETNSDWASFKVQNDADGVGWVMGPNQARQPALVGWRKAIDVVRSNMAGAIAAGQRALTAWLNKR